jgi:hypothetical protein
MIVGHRAMAWKKIKLEEEAINEILDGDNPSELGAVKKKKKTTTTAITTTTTRVAATSLSRSRRNQHWPVNLTALPSVFFS